MIEELPTTIVGWVDSMVDTTQAAFERMMEHRPDSKHMDLNHYVHCFVATYALAALQRIAGDDRQMAADTFAEDLACALDSGDFSEWVHQWRTELDAEKPLTLPYELGNG
jgi:nicotinic acid phosphoribosyltransferase